MRVSKPISARNVSMLDLSTLDFAKGDGLVTIVTQDATTGVVLMVAHADRDALARTIETGVMHYRSRTRGLWRKGDTSGNVQRVVSLTADCDRDAVLARVIPAGPACHAGTTSCFGTTALIPDALSNLNATVASRASTLGADATVSSSYTHRLLGDRNLRLKKIGEEAAELLVALADDDGARSAEEAADLVYHTVVGLRALGISMDDVRRVLADRAAMSPGDRIGEQR
jgi:phosphoribosyl-ATP pyrophosphohydrolase/phosphoribosyl-AMP cyclohydrolase